MTTATKTDLGFGHYAIFNDVEWRWDVYDRGDIWQADFADEDPALSLQAARDAVARWNQDAP